MPQVSNLPVFSIDGETIPGLSEGLIELEVELSLNDMGRCQARFSNWGSSAGKVGYLYFDRQTLDFGALLGVELVSGQEAQTVFTGRIRAIEGLYPADSAPQVSVRAEDALQALRLIRRTRLFHDASAPEVVAQVAAEHGLAMVSSLNRDYPTETLWVQFEQSDLAFLLECARSAGLDLWARGNELLLGDTRTSEADIHFTYGSSLLSFAARADLAEQVTSLSMRGWDVQAKQAIDEMAVESAIRSELDGRRSGSRYLAESFGLRPESLEDLQTADAESARALAQTAFRQRARRFVVGEAITQGDPRLRPGGAVHLDGLGQLFSGLYSFETVRHHYDLQSGYRCELVVSRPGLEPGRRSRGAKGPKGIPVARRPLKTPPAPTGRKLK